MPPERWEKIKDLVGRALAMSQSERDVFLKTEAAGDDQLRTEAEALISQKDRVGNFLGQPLFGNLGAQVFPSSESETLGGFRISKLLGSGGMGRVYQALELANNREVALKVLNANFSLDRHDVARFEREAWIGGRLKHPYIVAAYGQGEIAGLYCIWMELLEGAIAGGGYSADQSGVGARLGREHKGRAHPADGQAFCRAERRSSARA